VIAYSLMYHDVVARGREDGSGFPGGESARYKLTLEAFAGHLQAIRARARRHPASAETLYLNSTRSVAPADHQVFLTFDDGGASAASIADCLEVLGWRGHFFVTTNYIGRPGFLTSAQIRDLHTRGHVIGSHSCSHPLRMAQCPAPRLREEWARSVSTLRDLLGEPCPVASVPGGEYSSPVGDTAAAAGIRVLFTSRPTVRVRQHGEMRVLGRFAIRSTTGPQVAAAVAAGRWAPRVTQLVCWDIRTAIKSVAWPAYQHLRTRRLGRSADVHWGDNL
jgi:peptidoglycan/xylan/chitin deacetylase (PgdA/CDA1 family)